MWVIDAHAAAALVYAPHATPRIMTMNVFNLITELHFLQTALPILPFQELNVNVSAQYLACTVVNW